MTQTRTTENPQRKIIHHMSQTVDDMIEYIANLEDVCELKALVKCINKDGYDYFLGLYHLGQFIKWLGVRDRDSDIDILIAAINQSVNATSLVEAVAAFFKSEKGGWKSTSSNTYLLCRIISKLPAYSVHDSFLDTEKNREEMGKEFVRKAKAYRPTEKFVAAKQSVIRQELKDLSASIMSQSGDDNLAGRKKQFETLIKKRLNDKEPSAVVRQPVKRMGKLNPDIVNKVREKLDDILMRQSSRVETFPVTRHVFVQEQPFDGVVMAPPSPPRSASPEILLQEHPFEELAMAPPPPPPPPPPLSISRPASPTEISKSDTRTYIAPPRKSFALTDAQLAALNNLYGVFAQQQQKDQKAEEQSVMAAKL